MQRSDVTWEAPAAADQVRPVRAFVRAYAHRVGLGDEQTNDAVLAVWEAVANACVHAFPDRDVGTIKVALSFDDEGMVALVSDNGVGMRPRLDSPGAGLGLALIGKLTDSYEVASSATDGVELTLRFAVNHDRGPGTSHR